MKLKDLKSKELNRVEVKLLTDESIVEVDGKVVNRFDNDEDCVYYVRCERDLLGLARYGIKEMELEIRIRKALGKDD